MHELVPRFIAAFVVAAVSAPGCWGQSSANVEPSSPKQLIRFLTGPPIPQLLNKNVARRAEPDRAVANALVAMGRVAVDDLDAAFDQVDRPGQKTSIAWNLRWLLFAYARIQGPAASQRLRAMVADPRFESLGDSLDNSLAIAFILTSYVSASRVWHPFICCRSEEPRHSLDRLILAWMQNDRSRIEDELGPKARAALDLLLANHSWLAWRSKIWGDLSKPDAAMGFRFWLAASDDWSKPEETLDQGLQDRRRAPNGEQFPPDASLLTEFADRMGKDCGERRTIRFVRVPRSGSDPRVKYVVDDEDLEGLLGAITVCAVR
jgi:hypothetical protein